MFAKFDIGNMSNMSIVIERKNDNIDVSYNLGRIDGIDIDCDIETKPLVERDSSRMLPSVMVIILTSLVRTS